MQSTREEQTPTLRCYLVSGAKPTRASPKTSKSEDELDTGGNCQRSAMSGAAKSVSFYSRRWSR